MDSKGLITAEKWKQFCSEVVPLFTTSKFCWTNDEQLKGQIKIANYSEQSLEGKEVFWELISQQGEHLDKGEATITSRQIGLMNVVEINPKISSISNAQRLNLNLQIKGTAYANSYPLWVYPKINDVKIPREITVTDTLNAEVLKRLINGEKVLWFPKHENYKKQTVDGLFQTDYWNFRMFKTISENNKKPVSPGTMGILTNSGHPIFKNFPTDFHTNWQWFSIVKVSYPFILDLLPHGYKPIVQVIDNIERNHKLGLIFEFGIGKGKLLICMSDLNAVKDKPEVKQLYESMFQYMISDDFKPEAHISTESLIKLLNTKVELGDIKELRNISYD